MSSTKQKSLKENAPISKGSVRKDRGRRSRKQASNVDHHPCCWDVDSAHEPLLTSSRNPFMSEESCRTTQGANLSAASRFTTPVKGHQSVNLDSQNDISSPEADRAPFRPLGATANRSRPPFLSPRKPRNIRAAKPVRAMMDVFLDSRARSDMEDESDDESFRDIGRRLGISKHMSTPESPTPPSSRASSREKDSVFSTPTRASKSPSPEKSPRHRSGFCLWRAQEYQEGPLKSMTSPGAKSWTPTTSRDGFWRREAERLRMCAPKILLPSWHLGLAGKEDEEDTERLMTLAEVCLAELEVEVGGLDPPERPGFDVSGDRSTAGWP